MKPGPKRKLIGSDELEQQLKSHVLLKEWAPYSLQQRVNLLKQQYNV